MATKLRILTLLLVLSFPLLWREAGGEVSAQITDNFSDGNFSSSPAWVGNDTDFTVNTSQQLQLNSSGAGESYLCLPNSQSLAGCEWNFWIHLNFSPSSSNYSRVYLSSTQQDLSAPLNGYYLQFGESLSNDRVELFRQSGSSSVSVCKGTTVIANAFSIRVKVTRDSSALWKLYVDPAGGNNYVLEASGTDSAHTTTAFFGVRCNYTTSNATNFFFDDFYIYSPPDTVPAGIDSLIVVNANSLDVYFSEALNVVSAQTTANYSVDNGIAFASSALLDATNSGLVHLFFANSFVDGENYKLTVTGVQDLAGNNTVNAQHLFLFVRPLPGDIIINEILFDPFEGGVEWVEIYNRSTKTLNLQDVFLCSRDKNGVLSEINQISTASYAFPTLTYLVLGEDGVVIQSHYHTENPSAFLNMANLPSLNNDSDKVVLADAAQAVIDEVHYGSSWHLSLLNSSKGVSLEKIHPDNAGMEKNNWHSAAETAGWATPGYKNSQYLDGGGGTAVTISPEIFSPDNDGYNDVLGISYAFDAPGFICNIQVYDSRGRLECSLVQNELLGTSGTFYWDGYDHEKLRSRLGIYIIYFEVFDTKGAVKKYKKACVLGGNM